MKNYLRKVSIKRIIDLRIPAPRIAKSYISKKFFNKIWEMKAKKDLQYWIEAAFLFFTFFPYIYLVPIINSDIQPYALVVSFLLAFIWFPKRIPKLYTLILALLFFSTLFLFLDSIELDSIRNYLGYFSLSIQIYAAYAFFKRRGIPNKFIYYAVIIWGFVGTIQWLIHPRFLQFLMKRAIGGGHGRGVFGLAAEPTFYGIVCLLFSMIVFIGNHPKKKLLILFLFYQIIFLAKSSMIMVYLMALLGIYILFTLNWQRLVGIALAGLGGLYLLFDLSFRFSQIRIFSIFKRFFQAGLLGVIRQDDSVNDRVAHIYYSIRGFFENNLLPHGYLSFKDYLLEELPKSNVFWWVNKSNKILSAYGAVFWELGIFGLVLPVAITSFIWNAMKANPVNHRMILIIFTHIFLFSGIPISMPPLAFFLGLAIYKSVQNEGSSNSQLLPQ